MILILERNFVWVLVKSRYVDEEKEGNYVISHLCFFFKFKKYNFLLFELKLSNVESLHASEWGHVLFPKVERVQEFKPTLHA